MADREATRVDKIINCLKNNKALSVLIACGIIIIAIAAVINALSDIRKFFSGTREPKIELVKVTVTKHVEKYGHSFRPALDYRLKNTGGETAIITDLTLEIIEVDIDSKPVLYFQLLPTQTGDLQLRIVNLGWGPALDTEIHYLDGPIRQVIDERRVNLTWTGTIHDHIILTIPANSINTKVKAEFSPDQISGIVQYKDTAGRTYKAPIKYDSVPRQIASGWQLVVTPARFEIKILEPDIAFKLLPPSAVYDVLLNQEETPYTVNVPISQAIAPGEPDRFLIVTASSKSANYLVRSHLQVDGKKAVNADPVPVEIKFPRLLPSFGYRVGLSLNMKEADPFEMKSWLRKAISGDLSLKKRRIPKVRTGP